MRVSRVIFWFVFCLSLPGQISSLFGQSVTSLIHDVSSVADGSVTQARLEAQRQAMGAGPAYRSSEKDDFRSFSGRYTPPELSEDKKGRFVYGLALFSDDGCNVTVDSSPIHQRLGRAQHLPDIGTSFQVLQTLLAPGEPIDITVNYSNIIYNDDPDSPDYPDIDGCTLFLYLIPAAIAVDANRDGTIAFSGEARDTTSQDAPFRFWCNDDNDGLPNSEGDVVGPSSPDHEDGVIQTARDLEDFTRLWLKFDAFQKEISEGTYRIGLKWKTTGSPSIKLYRSTDTNGSDSYLKDEEAALKQISGKDTGAIGTVASETSLMLPTDLWSGSGDQEKLCLLFEGSQEGKGQLVLTIEKSDGTEIGEGPGVWLDLKNIKKMYVRGKGTPESGVDAPYESYLNQPNPPPTWYVEDQNGHPFSEPHDETDSLVVFVHGIHAPFVDANSAYISNIVTAETVFKRLWHQGFKGRFAFYKWPALNPAGFGSTGFEYNFSEYRAWKYGRGLAGFVSSISKASNNLFAHSQGNIVCGAALTDYDLTIDNYVLTQAAVPAGSYDASGGQNDPNSINGYARFWAKEARNPTPDFADDLGYRGYLAALNASGNAVNFHNFDDFALASGRALLERVEVNWEANEDSYKPDGSFSNSNWYTYVPSNPTGQRCQLVDAVIVGRFVTDPHESMALVARPRSKAVGARAGVQGSIDDEFDLAAAPLEFSPSSDDHSAQVARRIQQVWFYYTELGDALRVLSAR